jgi:uncharacterized coiled-coil DUF342 family protein
MNETLFEELAEITIPTQPISKDLLDEAIDLLLDIRSEVAEFASMLDDKNLKIRNMIDDFLDLVDEKNKVMYE